MAQQIVNSYTEWDPLEEVVVGRVDYQPDDATIVPLAPGKLLVNPERYVPNELFHRWEILEAPKPTLPTDWPMYFCIPLDFRHVYTFGGSFHCVTLDVRRRGSLRQFLK